MTSSVGVWYTEHGGGPMERMEAEGLGLTQYEGKECSECGRTKRRTVNGACVYCHNKYVRDREKVGGDRHQYKMERNTAARYRRKEKVFSHYGKKCSICGFDDMRALTIDHTNQDGFEHKTPNGKKVRGFLLYRFLISNGFPDGFRTLCCNCQAIAVAEYEGRNENGVGGERPERRGEQ